MALVRSAPETMGLLKVSVAKQATIETELAAHLPAVRANSALIWQLVMNLVTNASEAIGDRGGVIRVISRRVTPRQDAKDSKPLTECDYVHLEISDTGCGMALETQARVFEPFFSTKSIGRGLGLASVDGIVRSLGGTVQLESELGKGTTVRISLPCAETDSQTFYGTMRAVEPLRLRRVATVLVVEDEDTLRQAVSKTLDKMGFSTIQVADGSAALDVIRSQQTPIDVLLLDVTIPGASSREVMQEAKRLRPEMKVIVASAYTEEVAMVSLQSSCQQFLRKPYRLDALVELMRQIVS